MRPDAERADPEIPAMTIMKGQRMHQRILVKTFFTGREGRGMDFRFHAPFHRRAAVSLEAVGIIRSVRGGHVAAVHHSFP